MSKLIFIEANTTGTGMIALTRAVDWGLEPVLYTNNPDRYRGLEDIECEVYVCDTNDINELQQHISTKIGVTNICGVTTTSEFYLEQVAKLITFYQLPGNGIETIRYVRNKAQTRNVLKNAHILQPHFDVLHSEAELNEAIQRIGFPCVIKPTEDSGSNEVKLCTNIKTAQEQVRIILDHSFNKRGQAVPKEVLIEKYIEAPEYSVETISWQGRTTVIGVTQKSLEGLPFFVEAGHLFPAKLTDYQYQKITATVLHALQVVHFKNGAAHTEVKWTKEGCLIIEINGRLAGGMIPELIRLTTGIDMLEQHIYCAIDGPCLPNLHYKGTAGIRFLMSNVEGEFKELTGIDQLKYIHHIKESKVYIQLGETVVPPQNAYQRLGYIVAYSPTFDETVKALDQAIKKIEIKMK
ncbi:Argininosuccinate lyase [Paenibacillus nuruki]|uniref:Argininosuccinate lyase n=1 Tax=Paenibacillus nuruki TaxID=1886670 RepID=A0A1E3LAB8_9BACL|nr:ATP-grasp domain-containing protein [Paenibacillus nuruki]ODP30115.1 Argininosuccinate lyase [Paenibacillus nuruki]